MNLETIIYGPEFTTEKGNTDRAKYIAWFNEDTQTFSAYAIYYNGGGQCLDKLMEISKDGLSRILKRENDEFKNILTIQGTINL